MRPRLRVASALIIATALGIISIASRRGPKVPPVTVVADETTRVSDDDATTPLSNPTDAADASVDADADTAADDDRGDPEVCKELRTTNEATIALAEKQSASGCKMPSEVWRDLSLCHATVDGAFGLRVAGVAFDDTYEKCGATGLEVALVHVDKAGHEVATLPGRAHANAMKDARGNVVVANYVVMRGVSYGELKLAARTFFDFDGDGHDEIYVQGAMDREGADLLYDELWSLNGGAFVRYGPSVVLGFAGVADIDGDGRPDLLVRGPYRDIEAVDALGNDYPAVPPMFAAHALPDGGFSLSDRAAKDAARKSCPQPVPVDLHGAFPLEGDVVKRIVCARLWGTNADHMAAALTARCSRDAGFPECPPWLATVGAVTPPFELTKAP